MDVADHIQDLFEATPKWLIEDAAKNGGEALGLTWASALREDNDEASVLDRANARALERIMEAVDPESDDWSTWRGYIVLRVLDVRGEPTKIAAKVTEALLGLENYPILDEELHSEIEHERFDEAWEQDVIAEVESGEMRLRHGQRFIVDSENLPEDWQEKLYEQYAAIEPEPQYDDQGYALPNMATVVEALQSLGWGDWA